MISKKLLQKINEDIFNEYKVICEELDKYDQSIKEKRKIIALNKCDLKTESEIKKICKSRETIYSLSDYRIDCNAKNRSQIIEEIYNIYETK